MAFDNERFAFQAYSDLAQLFVKVIFVQAGDGREIGDIDSVELKRLIFGLNHGHHIEYKLVLAWRQRVAGRGEAVVLPNCAVPPRLVFDHFKGLKLRLLLQRHG